jgi:PHP family Zn ribbon phosphoesterase
MKRILADLHIHSTFSDGALAIPEIVDLYGRNGFGAIAITDHLCEGETVLGKAAGYLNRTLTPATFPLYREILRTEAERARKEYGMLLVPGFELTKNSVRNSRSAHIVALGVEEWISADGPIEGGVEEICDAIHAQGGLAIAAHPVSTRRLEKQTYHLWDRREILSEYFDAWEVASGKTIFEEVLSSGLPMIASSDMHRASQFESWKTVFRGRSSASPGASEVPCGFGGCSALDSRMNPTQINFDDLKKAVREQDLEFEYFTPAAVESARGSLRYRKRPIRRSQREQEGKGEAVWTLSRSSSPHFGGWASSLSS